MERAENIVAFAWSADSHQSGYPPPLRWMTGSDRQLPVSSSFNLVFFFCSFTREPRWRCQWRARGDEGDGFSNWNRFVAFEVLNLIYSPYVTQRSQVWRKWNLMRCFSSKTLGVEIFILMGQVNSEGLIRKFPSFDDYSLLFYYI